MGNTSKKYSSVHSSIAKSNTVIGGGETILKAKHASITDMTP